MAQIPHLQVGCTFADIIDTVNAILAVLNDGSGISVSYEDLEHKPTINGVELSGALTTGDLLLALSACTGYEALIDTLATKAYADAAKTAAVAAAQTAAQTALDSKMDKNLGNISAVDVFDGNALIPIVTNDGIKKTKLANVAVYAEYQAQTIKTAADTTIDRYRKLLPVVGEQNGINKVFTVTGGYKTGTASLYLNGQLMTLGRDYEETDTTTFTFIHIAPQEEDEITFRAIPLE